MKKGFSSSFIEPVSEGVMLPSTEKGDYAGNAERFTIFGFIPVT